MINSMFSAFRVFLRAMAGLGRAATPRAARNRGPIVTVGVVLLFVVFVAWLYWELIGLLILWVVALLGNWRHPWHKLVWQHVTGRRGLLRLWLLWAAVFGTGMLADMSYYGLAEIAGGSFANYGWALGYSLALAAILYGLFFAARRTPMPDIFKIASDKEALAAFTEEGKKRPLLEVDPLQLAAAIKSEVIGQDAIVDDVSGQLARRIRLARANRPLGVMMFVGATGAGKTELAKALAKHAFNNRLFRIDCNEMTVEHSGQRLIGSPPGYIGSEQGGQLTRAITSLGSGVILFDEIEKAHEAVLRIIMGLLDEGRLTEQSTGNVADASQFLVVMTSNAEHTKLAEIAATVEDPDDRRRAVKDTLQHAFRPEQLARIDDIYCFAPLDRAAMVQVVGKFLFHYAEETNVELRGVDSALLIDTVLRHERGAKYGIRELIRLVERAIVDGMLDRRAEGYNAVTIRCENDKVWVEGVPEDPAKRGGLGGLFASKVKT